MVVYEARWDRVGSGALPRMKLEAGTKIVDEIDVSDLESEKAHGYALLGGSDHDNVAVMSFPPRTNDSEDESPFEVADGGRQRRRLDQFRASFESGRSSKLVLRVSADQDTQLVVRVANVDVATVRVSGGEWVEKIVDVPSQSENQVFVEVTPKDPAHLFNSFHYWIIQ